MNKATVIRARAKLPSMPVPKNEYEEVYQSQTNTIKHLKELDDLSKKLKIESYIIMHEGEPIATIVFKYTENTLTSFVTRFINGRRAVTKKIVRGFGYDRHTSSLDGLIFYTPRFCLEDKGKRWYNQLADGGFKVWRTF